MFSRAFVAAAGCLALGACVSIGPQRVGVDRSDYANRLRETNKEQLLLNIVAMRYGDAPQFLDVTSVVSQYTREGQLHADVEIDHPSDDPAATLGGSIVLRETPSVTYTPLSGEHFARSMLSPLEPAALLGMIEAGWAPDLLFRIAARSINGVRNGSADPLFAQTADPRFERVLEALARLQRDRVIVTRVTKDDNAHFTASLHVSTPLSQQNEADLAFIRDALNIPVKRQGEFRIVFAAASTEPGQLAIGTRSMFQVLGEMAQGVDVPATDQSKAVMSAASAGMTRSLIHIRSGTARPSDVYAAARYRGHWFWIDGTDIPSKRAFLIAQVLLSVSDTSSKAAPPLLTIPAGG